jgi:hypothetical protein
MKLLAAFKGKKVLMKGVAGFITFDTNTTPESEYPTYHSLGFDFCFEPIEPTYKKPIAYVGIEQPMIEIEPVEKLIKVNKKKDGKKVKTETEKE